MIYLEPKEVHTGDVTQSRLWRVDLSRVDFSAHTAEAILNASSQRLPWRRRATAQPDGSVHIESVASAVEAEVYEGVNIALGRLLRAQPWEFD